LQRVALRCLVLCCVVLFCGACTLTHVLQLGAHRAAAVLLLLDSADFVPQLVELEFVLGRRLQRAAKQHGVLYLATC
jgi:hypothetical protein